MLTGVLVWAVVVAVAAGVTWTVIDAAGQNLLAGDDTATSAQDVPPPAASYKGRTLGPNKTSGPSKSASAGPTARPSRSHTSSDPSPASLSGSSTGPPVHNAEERVWQGPPGTVAVRCNGPAATLLSATPSNGYRVEAEHGGPDEIEVKFESGERETKVEAGCLSGVPRFKVGTDEGSGDD